MSPLYVDIETFCELDLTKVGAFRYVEHPSFEVLLIKYAFGDEPVQEIDLAAGKLTPCGQKILEAILNPEVQKVAHNAAFERLGLGKLLGKYLPPEEWTDTMVLALQHGLPGSLDGAGDALNLEQQKLKEGKQLIQFFCRPCKPTKANGGRTRNRPQDAPDKWERFKAYGARDVEVSREIHRLLRRDVVPEWEDRVRCLDARINERGVLLDLDLVGSAIAVDKITGEQYTAEMAKLTGLENPKSPAQLRGWLASVGLPTDTTDKKAIADLKAKAIDPTTRRVLELRQLTAKTSVTKYEAMVRSVCDDGRVRGLLQYYGASKTGRFAGRLVQLQNLPQNHLDDIADVRELVRAKDTEALSMLYSSIPDVLSQLIRTALVAKPGRTFLVADYHAIEAVCIAYLSREQWRLDVFAGDGKIYERSYAQAFGVPVESVKKGSPERQKGKIMELACVAKGEKVLTDHGLVPIERVTRKMKVWDGENFVEHGGVVYRGERDVIEYDGLRATADHIVWIEGLSEPVHFGLAAASGAYLTKSGNGRNPIRVGGDHKPGKKMEQELEPLLCADTMHRLRICTVDGSREPKERKVKRLPVMLSANTIPEMALQKIRRSKKSMRKSEKCELQKLRSSWNKIQFFIRKKRLPVHGRDLWRTGQDKGVGQNQREWKLRTGESSLCHKAGEQTKPENHRSFRVGPEILAVREKCGNSYAGSWKNSSRDYRVRENLCKRETKKLAKYCGKVRVYDIRDAGPNHRFTVSDKLVHNCGYGGGIGALKAFGADKMGLTEPEMVELVQKWRAASPRICRLWRECENAARSAIERPGHPFRISFGAAYRADGRALWFTLPSRRRLCYWGAYTEEGQIKFKTQNQMTRKWETTTTWGGKLVENIVQAYARDVLATALLRLDAEGYHPVFHVHDEIICEEPDGKRWDDMAAVMTQPIPWAPGLDKYLEADGYATPFYKKD